MHYAGNKPSGLGHSLGVILLGLSGSVVGSVGEVLTVSSMDLYDDMELS